MVLMYFSRSGVPEFLFLDRCAGNCSGRVLAAERALYTRALMISSAIFMTIVGLVTSFAPEDVLRQHGSTPDNATLLLVQMMGAIYLGFALLNWMARGVLIGGIYARPVAMGNFLHFAMIGVMLAKAAIVHAVVPLALSAAVYCFFAAWFGIVLFRPGVPVKPG